VRFGPMVQCVTESLQIQIVSLLSAIRAV
jgi:hypothetical protein